MGNITISEIAKDFIINIFNIIILFVIIKSLVYKPVKKFLNDRTQRIENLKKSAEEKEKDAKELLTKYDSMIADYKIKSAEIISTAEQQAKKNATIVIDNANQSAKEIINKACLDAESEKKNIMQSLQGDITSLAINISKQILKREVNDDDSIKIAADFFSHDNDVANNILNKSAKHLEEVQKSENDKAKSNIASLAVDISEKILSHSVNDEDNLKIAEEFFGKNK